MITVTETDVMIASFASVCLIVGAISCLILLAVRYVDGRHPDEPIDPLTVQAIELARQLRERESERITQPFVLDPNSELARRLAK